MLRNSWPEWCREDNHDPDGLWFLSHERGRLESIRAGYIPGLAPDQIPYRCLPAGEQRGSGPDRPPESGGVCRYFDIPKKEAREKAIELLDFIALGHRSNAPVTELSGGMMRRLVLARSLINHPDLLVLDRPTTGLDPQSRHQLWARLEELRGRGISILLTTHYMEEASRLCDRLIIIDHGLILVEGRAGGTDTETRGQECDRDRRAHE